jgi:hypothetical protein
MRREMVKALHLVRGLSCVSLIGLAGMTAAAEFKKDPRLSQRPLVADPTCSNPKPYHIEHWGPSVSYFRFSLAPTVNPLTSDGEYFEREARRLAAKYKFEVDDVSLNNDGLYHVGVLWLEPEQVAALRCDMSVSEIGFARILAIISSGSPY